MALIHFIIDPIYSHIGTKWPYEQSKIEALTKDFKVHLIRGRSHAEALATQAKTEGAKLIVCLGGDRVFNELANALYPETEPSPRLCFHPLHASNLAKSLHVRRDFLEFLKDFLAGNATEHQLDVGEISYTGEYGQKLQRIFTNYASFGFASTMLSKLSQIQNTSYTKFRFLRLIFRNLPFYKTPALKLTYDDLHTETELLLTGFVNNIRYAARGLRVSPKSNPYDGNFEFTKIEKTYFYKYLFATIPFYAGTIKPISFINTISCKQLRIEPVLSHRNVRLDFDGECRGYLPAELKTREKSLRILT